MYFYFGILNWYAIVCVNKLYIRRTSGGDFTGPFYGRKASKQKKKKTEPFKSLKFVRFFKYISCACRRLYLFVQKYSKTDF